MRKAKIIVQRPEDHRAFTTADRARKLAIATYEAACRDMQKARDRSMALQGDSAAGAVITPAQWTENQLRLDKASATMTTAREELKRAEEAVRKARSEAARHVADTVRKPYAEAVAGFLGARLKRCEAEILAATLIKDVNDQLAARRVGVRGMICPGSVAVAENEYCLLREDAQTAIENGLLPRSDVPASLRDIWGL